MFKKAIVYLLLLLGSVVFIIPLLWMISTALKPIDQTMSMPPQWIPYRLFAERGGEAVEIRKGVSVESPSLVVQEKASGRRRIIPAKRYEDGEFVRRAGRLREERVAVDVLQQIPASPQDVWVKVYYLDDVQSVKQVSSDWTVVPVSSLIRKIAPRWNNFYLSIKAMKHFWLYLKNTLVLCFLTVIGTVVSSSLAAYGFSRIEWRGRDRMFVVALATMMVPFPVTMVPLYCLYKWMGWIGTLRPLWVFTFFAQAFNVFLLRQFFRTIPKDLSEAARIDGCSEFRIFWQIILPLCRPALMVVGLFQFMATWNDFLGPLIYLTDQKDYTLALGLQFFQSQHGGTEWNYLMAASTLVALPIIGLFFFTQRSFIEGISMSGLKG
jgi:multiple sugar transport system permease protein